MKKIIFYLYFLVIIVLVFSCQYRVYKQFRQTYRNAGELPHPDATPKIFLKAHMKNGDLFVFSDRWKMDTSRNFLVGESQKYNFKREALDHGNFSIPVDDVAIFETNQSLQNKDAARIAVLAIMTGVDLALCVYCITNPKACFGSCPTFYYKEDYNINYANAEGFSASICPALEAGDIDALCNEKPTNGKFDIIMKNEALETHAVNQVQLLAVPRRTGHRIFHDEDGNFYDCEKIYPLSSAIINCNNVTELLKSRDGIEYYSTTDSNDLSRKDTIDLLFNNNNINAPCGILIDFRQTLLTTFLLYTAYGYMGDEAGNLFSVIEGGKLSKKKLQNPYKLLGGIDIWVYNTAKDKWQLVQTLYETGPIARNMHLAPLPEALGSQPSIKVKLVASKGYWRLDDISLASGLSKAVPLKVVPSAVLKNDVKDTTAFNNLLQDDKRYEVAFPGDRYRIQFNLPTGNRDYELFIYSKGYYLEWMRKSWLTEKNIPKLMAMLNNDRDVWHSLAKEFKTVEGQMESTFWNSKIQTNVSNY